MYVYLGEGVSDSESVPKRALAFLVKLINNDEKVKPGKIVFLSIYRES